MWSPVQQLTILGDFIDTEKHLIYIPEERLLKVFKTKYLIEYNLEKFSKVSVRLAASLVGQICLCLSYITRILNHITIVSRVTGITIYYSMTRKIRGKLF
jgi:hypothetical protein